MSIGTEVQPAMLQESQNPEFSQEDPESSEPHKSSKKGADRRAPGTVVSYRAEATGVKFWKRRN